MRYLCVKREFFDFKKSAFEGKEGLEKRAFLALAKGASPPIKDLNLRQCRHATYAT